jgi:DNA-binding transcriptional ArsR family regulator
MVTLSKAHFLGWASQTRLRLIEELARSGETTVLELAMRLRISQPRVSWHLRILRRAQIVKTRRAGRQVHCSLDVEAIRRHQETLRQLLEAAERDAVSARRQTKTEINRLSQEGA